MLAGPRPTRDSLTAYRPNVEGLSAPRVDLPLILRRGAVAWGWPAHHAADTFHV